VSVIALAWVLRHSEAKLGARLVLLSLADFAHDDGGKAFPSIETLCQHTRMSRSAVKDALKRLKADGSIVEQGATRSGTVIYRVVLGGRIPTGGSDPAGRGSDSGARGPDSGPDPSIEPSEDPTPSPKTPSSKRVLSPEEEPELFAQWLGFHVVAAGRLNLSLSVPRAGTSYRSSLARTFAALVAEGYGREEFELASLGVLSDDFMRAGGHVKPENVLRKEKIGGRIDAGRAFRAAGGEGGGKYGGFDG
jgi:hypothetical protein